MCEARTRDKPPGMRWPIAVIAMPIGVPTWAAVPIDPMSDPSGADRGLRVPEALNSNDVAKARPATRATAKTITASAINIESLSPASRGSLSFRHFKWNLQSSPYHLRKAQRGLHGSAARSKGTSPLLRFAPADGASLRPAIPRALRGSTRNSG